MKRHVALYGLLVAPLALTVPVAALADGYGDAGPGPRAGDREFILSGNGSSDKDFSGTTAGMSADLGWYWTDALELGIRQSVNYADIQGKSIDEDHWNGATRGFADYHFGNGPLRPFLGMSLGEIYGDGVNDSAFAGPELGMKYYVRQKTFIMGRAEYQFTFEEAHNADERFDEGSWAYGLGIGYNF